ncbi:hypothetical protein HBN54_003534 [Hymenobacter sp. 1B]|uniref:Uncharacterized protein n=1 Tax=Hymenobacter artigasi TaxID=2719616 RepID=A0ABX1HPH0_9BACT|nr:hypothetical protein [Hymenobacter artigasi]
MIPHSLPPKKPFITPTTGGRSWPGANTCAVGLPTGL